MHDWLVGGALIESAQGLLLVRNKRRGGRVDWTPPGGVIDAGESLIDGLTREVTEETGLAVASWSGPCYEIRATAPGLGWRLRVEAWVAADFAGELRIGDPDGIVDDARFVAPGACMGHLEGGHPWVVEPLEAWLSERWNGSRAFEYLIEGDDPASMVVTRL